MDTRNFREELERLIHELVYYSEAFIFHTTDDGPDEDGERIKLYIEDTRASLFNLLESIEYIKFKTKRLDESKVLGNSEVY